MQNWKTSETLDNDTSQHAAEVQACNRGTDIRDNLGPAWGKTAPTAIRGFPAGHFWEHVRPLEAAPPAPPRIAFPNNFQSRRGRFNSWGAGGQRVALLQARREF